LPGLRLDAAGSDRNVTEKGKQTAAQTHKAQAQGAPPLRPGGND
jgi:hypothetical protein